MNANTVEISKDEYKQLYNGEVLVKDCDECGGVNIRPKNGVNYSVHLIKRVRKTACAEVEVEDEFRTIDNKLVVQNADGELEDPPSEPEDLNRTATEPLGDAGMSQISVYVRDDSHVSAEKRPRDDTEGDTVVWNGDEDTLPVLEEKMLKLE